MINEKVTGIGPEPTVVITFPGQISQEMIEQMRSKWASDWPNERLLVLTHGGTATFIGPGIPQMVVQPTPTDVGKAITILLAFIIVELVMILVLAVLVASLLVR